MRKFQAEVSRWAIKCFGLAIAKDKKERNHRFLEESLELVQACGCSESEAHQLVRYVFSRDVGEKKQEVGGVTVTLAALCHAQSIDLQRAAQAELNRIWGKMDAIRAKQAGKPQHSPLPQITCVEESPGTWRIYRDGILALTGWSESDRDNLVKSLKREAGEESHE